MKRLAAVLLVAFGTLVTTDSFACSECCKESAMAAPCDCNMTGMCVICGSAYVPVTPAPLPVLVSVVRFPSLPASPAPIAVVPSSVYHPPKSL